MLTLIKLSLMILNLVDASLDSTEDQGYNRTVIQECLEREGEDSSFHVPGDKWTTEAIKDIAYYLRNHKFNGWDNQYYENRTKENLLEFFGAFPNLQLRSLHWEVKANCQHDFYKCITYLYRSVNKAPFSRNEDSANINGSIYNETLIKRMYYECKERRTYTDKIGLPFDDPAEKFQWSVTATHYMCWYTMLETPALSMIGESCDNFANCWDTYFGNHNHDPRADDNLSFKCALYSFCPDPCCPIKHIKTIDSCHNDKRNPCFLENTEDASGRVCHADRKSNQNFQDIINNNWNISCNCSEGFTWISKFGMCVDINECLLEVHDCDVTSQDCLNIPGTFLCICKWGFNLNISATLCLKSNTTFNLF